MKVTYSHTGFHNDQASYSNMKVFVFAETGYMQFIVNFIVIAKWTKSKT